MVHFHIITLFPESIQPYLNASMLGRAQSAGKIAISYYNPRDYIDPVRNDGRKRPVSNGASKWARVDRRPYGGGPGMVLAAEPYLKAVDDAVGRKKKDVEIIFFAPSGEQFSSAMARELSTKKHVVLITGHYEGVDARVAEILGARAVSVGPYVLTGGELPAATVIDAAARYVPGVLGKEESREDERVASSEVYTRPEVLKWKGKKYAVPEVLLSGHHAKQEEWRNARRTQ